MSAVTYSLKRSDNKFEVSLHPEKSEAWFEYMNIDESNIPLFFLLLKNTVNDLISKNYKFAVQTVSTDDWDKFLKENKKWEIVSTNNVSTIIKCNLSDAIECITKGFGIDK
jgi:hypothetical protein